ncbi:hypothetical protein AVEN_170991-1 [Araneus ventricosus]|uniref:RNase H type-1 domain-containing protein n=1 Tax=Araneus ventricosus TaxID=182803 RepID=A0A4Y2GHJ0_ARAVE|nr:hypothetical protein AVEN_170991-1 [Araneus ventricosus]
MPDQVSSSDRGSKLRGPSQNRPRVASKLVVNITKLTIFDLDLVTRWLQAGTSVFTSEIIAIQLALDFIEQTGFKKGIVYFESWSLLEALPNTAQDHPFIRDNQRRNSNFGRKGYDHLFSWIPAHVGNELADAAAKSNTEFHTHPLPYDDIRMSLRKWFLQNWQRKWDMEMGNKLYSVKPLLAQWKATLSRRYDIIIT